MSEQYFSKQPQSDSKPITWQATLKGTSYTFTSDEGVFSKGNVDFGTKLLIESFEAPEIAGDFLDLGCGYGPVGVFLADTFKERKVVMVDINERAVKLARENVQKNQLDNVKVKQSDQFSELENDRFAAILLNPPIRAGKKVVHQMFEESKKALVPHGELWIVIQKKQGAPSAKKKLEELFKNVETIIRKKGYFIFKTVNI